MRLTLGPLSQQNESSIQEWRNVSDVFLVNGHIEKTDANFVPNDDITGYVVETNYVSNSESVSENSSLHDFVAPDPA